MLTMPRYKLITFIDITRTGATKSNGNLHQLMQQSNFNSLRQSIELRSNVEWTSDPTMSTGQLPNSIDGKATYWVWEFTVEREDVFLADTNPVALLIDDMHGVPIIADLENSVELNPAAIQTKGNSINTWVCIMS